MKHAPANCQHVWWWVWRFHHPCWGNEISENYLSLEENLIWLLFWLVYIVCTETTSGLDTCTSEADFTYTRLIASISPSSKDTRLLSPWNFQMPQVLYEEKGGKLTRMWIKFDPERWRMESLDLVKLITHWQNFFTKNIWKEVSLKSYLSGETVKRDVYGNVKAKPEAKHNRYSSIHRLSFSICPELAKTWLFAVPWASIFCSFNSQCVMNLCRVVHSQVFRWFQPRCWMMLNPNQGTSKIVLEWWILTSWPTRIRPKMWGRQWLIPCFPHVFLHICVYWYLYIYIYTYFFWCIYICMYIYIHIEIDYLYRYIYIYSPSTIPRQDADKLGSDPYAGEVRPDQRILSFSVSWLAFMGFI